MRCHPALLAAFVALAGLLLPASSGFAARLVMFEQASCHWCKEWHQVIGPIYPKTPEAQQAPLWRVDIHAPIPPALKGIKRGYFTPTFVLIDDTTDPVTEIGRIRGYPGEDFFWGLLGRMLEDIPKSSGGAS